ncbi:MAG: hypothetical protein WBG86_12155, partial [Polyangiales bacterium]
MRLGIVVNVMDSDEVGATTYRLAADAVTNGHDVWIMSAGRLAYETDGTVQALGRAVPPGRYSSDELLQALGSKRAINKPVVIDELDVLLLRNNPSAQVPWAQSSGIQFGRLATRRGVIVLNDPNGLAKAMNKLYLQTFPECVRPRTLVTRHLDRVEEFLEDEGQIILKPLQGSGGTGVFIVRDSREHNLQEIFKSISRDGYVVAQEYLPAAAEGDVRLFLMNGVPLQHQGKYAAFRR